MSFHSPLPTDFVLFDYIPDGNFVSRKHAQRYLGVGPQSMRKYEARGPLTPFRSSARSPWVFYRAGQVKQVYKAFARPANHGGMVKRKRSALPPANEISPLTPKRGKRPLKLRQSTDGLPSSPLRKRFKLPTPSSRET